MRPSLTLGILLLAWVGCRPAASSPPAPSRCDPGVPATAQHPLAMRPAELAGDYELVQVQTQPSSGSKSSGRLHLSPLDSVAKAQAAGGAVRDLVGWLDASEADTARSEAVLAGQHLRLSQPDYPGAMAHHLTITAVSPQGFWGWWKVERGVSVRIDPDTRRLVPEPAGYFCASRSPT